MIYNSLDIIPAKLFLKIESSGDVSLLSTKKTKINLQELWEELVKENEKLSPNKQAAKTLDIYKQIEKFSAKYKSVSAAIYVLKRKEDSELIELLQNFGYRLRKRNFKKDLAIIEREVESLKNRINRLESQLPKKDPDKKKSSFDEVVLSYGAISGAGFIDTNKITLTQYYALINIGNQKIKALKDGK